MLPVAEKVQQLPHFLAAPVNSYLVKVLTLQAASGRKSPTAATLLLVFDWGHKTLSSPVNLYILVGVQTSFIIARPSLRL